MYIVGKIVNTHGIKGEVKIISLSDFDRFSIGSKIYYDDDKELTISHARAHKNVLIIKFKEFDNINDVLFLKGKEVYVNERFKDDSLDSYYFDELIGLEVFDKEKPLGRVSAIMEVPQGHILEIKNKDKKVLVPFVSAFVKEVLEGKIILDLIEGFYED